VHQSVVDYVKFKSKSKKTANLFKKAHLARIFAGIGSELETMAIILDNYMKDLQEKLKTLSAQLEKPEETKDIAKSLSEHLERDTYKNSLETEFDAALRLWKQISVVMADK
jgi:hypothetical protein